MVNTQIFSISIIMRIYESYRMAVSVIMHDVHFFWHIDVNKYYFFYERNDDVHSQSDNYAIYTGDS